MKSLTISMLGSMLIALAPGFCSPTDAQMEKRCHRLYLLGAFIQSAPAPGQLAPDMLLKTLDGKDCCLSDYFGQPLVIVKGSYT